jgi:hypothetical protein
MGSCTLISVSALNADAIKRFSASSQLNWPNNIVLKTLPPPINVMVASGNSSLQSVSQEPKWRRPDLRLLDPNTK